MKRWNVGFALLGMGFLFVHPIDVHADVINADNHPLIAGSPHSNAVLDEGTNRLWLDVTETLGLSLNEVSSMLGAGQEYEGWQLPHLSDIEELLINASIPYPTAPPGYDLAHLPGFNHPISDFLDIYGSPEDTDLGDQAEMWIRTNMPDVGRIVLSDGEYGNLAGHRARLLLNPVDNADRAFPTVGTALFRLVPEPSTLILISMGAVGLLSCVWRRNKEDRRIYRRR